MVQNNMNQKSLDVLLTPPDDWQWGEFYNQNNQKIRYGWNNPDNAKALIIIAEGRTETIEEYFETIRNFNAHGYACAIMDWQGQGLSYRHGDDNSRHHSVGFEQDISDFDEFLTHVQSELPKILFAHSMGGNITLRYLADNPNIFTCGIMISPMLALNPKRIIKYLSKAILGFAGQLNWMQKYAPAQSRWSEKFAHIAKYKVSSDKIRRELQPYLFKTRPELQCGGVTFGWLNEALKSIAILGNPDICNRITTPLFFATGGKDIVVDNDGTMKIVSCLPHATHQDYPLSQHQIHRERDDIRDDIMSDSINFIEKHLS